MIFYIARPSVLGCYKVFKEPPIVRPKANLVTQTIEIWFDPQPSDDPFTLYHLEKLFPKLAIPLGECWQVTIVDYENVSDSMYRIVVEDKKPKLMFAY